MSWTVLLAFPGHCRRIPKRLVKCPGAVTIASLDPHIACLISRRHGRKWIDPPPQNLFQSNLDCQESFALEILLDVSETWSALG